MIEIAGDMLEGGGQIIRTAITLAAVAGKDVRITKIREKRPNPGLQPQHVTAVKAIASITSAETKGLKQGSRELEFQPHGYAARSFQFDVGTAGSVPLILQALMPCLNYAPDQVVLDLIGGTDVKWSPPIDYVRFVVLPALQRSGYRCTIVVHRRGHYPRGGGKVTVTINPSKVLDNIRLLNRGELKSINGISHCVKLPNHVAERQAEAARRTLMNSGLNNVNITVETYPQNSDPHLGPGSGITLAANYSESVIGADSLGDKAKPAEAVGQEAASKLVTEIKSNAVVDRHLADILIPYMAISRGRSEIDASELTSHTITNIKVTEAILGVKFLVEREEHTRVRIAVDGIGLRS